MTMKWEFDNRKFVAEREPSNNSLFIMEEYKDELYLLGYCEDGKYDLYELANLCNAWPKQYVRGEQ